MGIYMGVELKITQNQKVSQSVIQQMAILQMNGLELDDYIKDLSMENPLVEVEEKKSDEEEEKRLEKLEWLNGFDEQNRIYERADREDSDFADILNIKQEDGKELEDVLMMQVIGKQISEEELQILEYLIENLDSRGYFVDSVEDVAVRLEISAEKVKDCLVILQTLEPFGIGAKNLSECLLIQLEQKEEKGGQYQIEKRHTAFSLLQ